MIGKVILHIGQSKTGTSSLQLFLSNSRLALQAGRVLYPDIVIAGSPIGLREHNSFADSLSDIKRYPWLSAEEYVDAFLKQLHETNCDTLLLSAESFFGTPQIWSVEGPARFFEAHRHKIERLKQLLPAESIHIVAYLRRQDLWLESAVAHIIRYEGLLGKKVYEKDAQIADYLHPHLDYLRLISLWDEIIKPHQFSVVPYEKDALLDHDIVIDFLKRTQLNELLPSQDIIPDILENQSWSREAITIKKQLNTRRKSKTSERFIIDTLNMIESQRDALPAGFTFDPEVKSKTLEHFKADNRLLAQKYNASLGSFFNLPHKDDDNLLVQEDDHIQKLFDYLRKFETEYYSPKRWIREAILFAKGFFRKKFPLIHTKAKILLRKLSS